MPDFFDYYQDHPLWIIPVTIFALGVLVWVFIREKKIDEDAEKSSKRNMKKRFIYSLLRMILYSYLIALLVLLRNSNETFSFDMLLTAVIFIPLMFFWVNFIAGVYYFFRWILNAMFFRITPIHQYGLSSCKHMMLSMLLLWPAIDNADFLHFVLHGFEHTSFV
jgi:uncharacterized membrane protein